MAIPAALFLLTLLLLPPSVQHTPIRKIALSRFPLFHSYFLLICGRSLRPSSARQTHASMICLADSVWLNCYLETLV